MATRKTSVSGSRLRMAMAARGVSVTQLSQRLKIPRATMHLWLSRGLERADADRFIAICDFLAIRGRWIFTGRGLMDAGAQVDLSREHAMSIFAHLDPAALDAWMRLGVLLSKA